MHECCWEEDYFEPSATDEILMEFKEKMKDALLNNVKTEIDNIKKENETLRFEIEKLKNRERSVNSKENELIYKEQDLERQFYAKKFSELLNPFLENYSAYCVDIEYIKQEKCSKCNEDRRVVYQSSDGDEITQKCKCDEYFSCYVPTKTNLEKIDLWKDKYNGNFAVTPKWENKSEDDCRWSSLKLSKIVEKFDETKANEIDKWETVFPSKKECQKFCDYLNKKTE